MCMFTPTDNIYIIDNIDELNNKITKDFSNKMVEYLYDRHTLLD